MAEIADHYSRFYEKRDSHRHIYPVEFVVRAFLGTSYPKLKMDRARYAGSRVLDVGFGDGRNFPLFHNLGFQISGVEISEEILQLGREKFREVGIPVDLKLGSNSSIPYDEATFDYVVACHAIYYVSAGQRFDDNLAAIARVTKPGGVLLASFPKPTSYILRDAKRIDDEHAEITSDPLGLRNGSLFYTAASKEHIARKLEPAFGDFVFADLDDDFYGIQQNCWVVVAKRR